VRYHPNIVRTGFVTVLLLSLLTLAAGASAQDPVAVAPALYKVEVDNPWVRVLRTTRGPRQKSPMHTHPATVVVCLTDSHQRVTTANGMVREVSHKAGDVVYNEPVTHAEESLSDQPLEAVVVELKPNAPKSATEPRVTLDPVKIDPKYHIVALENPRVRALRTILEPGIKSPLHEHPHYVVVYLTELHTTMELADGRQVDNPRRPGEVAWRDFMKHSTLNIGKDTAVEIQIELK
jgi:quercetin dioxygenase-like cupin family protein